MKKVRKKEAYYLFKSSFELSNQAIFLINKEGQIVFANDKACRRLAYSKEELAKLCVWDVDTVFSSKEMFLEAFDKIVEDNSDKLVLKTYHKKSDGTLVPVEINSKVVEIDNENYIISYADNISEKIESQEKEKLYYEFLKSSNDIIFMVNVNSKKIDFANEKACEVLGYSLDELKSMKISQVRKAFEGEAELPEVFRKIREKKKLITQGKYLCANGDLVSVETSLSIKNYRNQEYILAISRDITERLELNDKLEEYNKRLKKEVDRIQNELVEYERIIHHQSKMAAMGEMIQNIAHQWRQPLSSISVLASGMKFQDELNLLKTDELYQGLDDINKNVQYLSDTIDDFRNFFKPNNERSEFNIREVIDYSVSLLISKFNDIEIFIETKDFKINTYRSELIQVVVNILNNAADALASNNIDKKMIFIEAYEQKEQMVLKIKDNALGIPLNLLLRVFEPYFTTKHQSKGTGIGLYMSDEIIRKHMKGNIIVKNIQYRYENMYCKGAEFTIKIPK